MKGGIVPSYNYFVEHKDQWHLPVVRVTDVEALNPFKSDGVELHFAIAEEGLPYGNTKFLTVLGLLQDAKNKGMLEKIRGIVEASSGNTGKVLAYLAPHFGVHDVQLVVNSDVPEGKRVPMVLAGAKLISPHAGLSSTLTARGLGGGGWNEKDWHPSDDNLLNLDQYANPAGTHLHYSFTGPQIVKGLGRVPNLFVASMGTGGTIVGISNFLKEEGVTIGGVLVAHGDEVPGIRDREHMVDVRLPWKSSADTIVEVAARMAYFTSLRIGWGMAYTPGPSSGCAVFGALKIIADKRRDGTLDTIRGKDGKVRVVVLLPDGSTAYPDRFMAVLPNGYQRQETAPSLAELLS